MKTMDAGGNVLGSCDVEKIVANVSLRPWSEGDLGLLQRLMGDPAMTTYLGGPESPEKILDRHRHRYVVLGDDPSKGRMFVITVGADRVPSGSIGYWDKEWAGETVWETGWSVLPEFQGQGIATTATLLVAEEAFAVGLNRPIHAFPSVENGASNAICRKAGFTLLGAFDFEYPPGHQMRCNDWVLETSAR